MRPVGPRTPPIAGGAGTAAAVASEADALAQELEVARRRALRTSLTIAAAIGVHNFAEGLAIGVSARAGAISLATVLIVGFGLHNATEGFGIVGPLGDVKPSWGWLGLVGLIGGAPTFIGTMVGYAVTSHPLELAFYALAGGAIIYVIGEIWNGMRRYGYRELGLLMLSAGFLVGVLVGGGAGVGGLVGVTGVPRPDREPVADDQPPGWGHPRRLDDHRPRDVPHRQRHHETVRADPEATRATVQQRPEHAR